MAGLPLKAPPPREKVHRPPINHARHVPGRHVFSLDADNDYDKASLF